MTPAQALVLEFIEQFILTEGMPPTRGEISYHFGWSSINAAQTHLKRLHKAGYIHITPGKARAIRLAPVKITRRQKSKSP